ncbi:hypothetical protein SAMN05444671_1372 [Flavobacterium sp. CF108]|uniref:T9SS type A sorting domain-containing protein n=1 Tax=unclassified Flavobacterium TaxID=196869 RepID=UPI0008AED595|nr:MULTISPECIES: T9SS type A sorting domain-containing protein [unclassified Flavobacterium]SEO80447.1 hypothetical protein SAMN04487978_3681 [Flavobacterium sp. fv08]SHG75017.1 hypothetical protein SAMN05444671_1372 [Flavobacterium sp. CF108]
MRKNYIYAIFVFLLAFTSFGQKVTLTPTTVNGQSVSGGPINLGGTPNSTIGLGVTVEMPTIPGNYGTITIHSVNGLNDNIVTGGNGGALFFGEGKSASRSFVINLLWSSFTTSGSYIYAEYKTGGGVIYKSSNLAIIKNATQGGGTPQIPADAPDPAKIPNSICCNQTVRQGDKPATITGSQYLNPYQGQTYGINASWQVNGNPNVRIIEVDNANKTLSLDYVENLGNFTVMRGLGYPTTLTAPNKSNTVTITVVPSPILSNEISVDDPVNADGFVEIISTNPKQISGTTQGAQVNLNILQDPFHTSQRGDTFTAIERFEWQYAKTNKALGGNLNWITINSSHPYNLESFNPLDQNINEDNYYLLRRIAIYQNIKRVSNTLKLVLRNIRNNNTICCDQVLSISASNEIESPTSFIGSTAVSNPNQYFTYQWQSQSMDQTSTTKLGKWANIIGATSKDYTPTQLQLVSTNRGRGEISWSTPITFNYRRLTVLLSTNEVTSYSNEVNLSSSSYKYLDQGLIVYPNPASSVITIEKKGTILNMTTTSFRITNVNGLVVNSNNYSIISPSIISVNVSNLPFGMYFINFDISDQRSIQATFMKN